MAQLLYLGVGDPLYKSRLILLARAGYKISEVTNPDVAMQQRSWRQCVLVLLSPKIDPDFRRRLGAEATRDHIEVLDLGSPANHRKLSSHGPEVFLQLVGEAVMAAHHHPEVDGEIVAWVDSERRYVHVTDGFLELVGYDRDEVVGCRIDDFTYPGTADAAAQFHRYLEDGRQVGRYFLRHKTGKKVAVDFEAGVAEDGCMYSNLKPADE